MKGLTQNEAVLKLEHDGFNILIPPKRDPWYVMLFEGFKDPLIIILLVAAAVSLILGCIKGEFTEPIGIIVAIAIAVCIGFWNTWSAGKKFDLLMTSGDSTLVKVYRDGLIVEIQRKFLVNGDVVALSAGEEIPADIILSECTNLKVDESTMTGESVPVSKNLYDKGSATYPTNKLLKSTIITEGTCEGTVIATGDNTEIGKTAREASSITDVETPLNKQLNGLANLINKIAFSAAGLLIVSLLIRYFCIEQTYLYQDVLSTVNDLLQFVMIAVALIVVAVPEGLPMAVTLALAYSMKRMARANNLIRKMHACETLGSTTLILTDKTGTLTKNEMTVVNNDIVGTDVMNNATINSTATLAEDGSTIGNPTEGAILRALGYTQETLTEERKRFNVVKVIEFNSKNKYMLTVIQKNDGSYVHYIKGAPEVVEKFCNSKVSQSYKEHQKKGRRCIMLAHMNSDSLDMKNEFMYDYTYAIEDPVRDDVPQAIKDTKDAGINVKIVTGDNPETAASIAKDAGINDNPSTMLGTDIYTATDSNLKKVDVFARTKPEDKQYLVKRFQQMGEVVASVGDGSNDSAALNQAQVGIAFNNGTDIAKNAADVILLDSAYPSIPLGVKWGRSLYKNIQHFILFQLTVNVVAIIIACIGPFIGVDLPFTVTQMLWVNLIMDTFAALALATEPANDIVMTERPRDPKAFIITKKMWMGIIGYGVLFTIILLVLLVTNACSLSEFFTIFVMLQFWNLFNARVFGQNRSIFNGLLKNKAFIAIATVIFIGQILIVQFGGNVFRTEPLSLTTWLYIVGVTSLVTIVPEIFRTTKKLVK